MRNRLILTGGLVLGALLLLGGLFSSPRREIARDLRHLRDAIVADDFTAAGGYLTENAKRQWWLRGLESAFAARGSKPDPHRRLIEGMTTTYRDMVRSIDLVAVDADGEGALATVRMSIVLGGYAYALEFPTQWQRSGDHWRLDATLWDSRRLINAHTAAHNAAGRPPENHPGYPTFSIGDQNRFRWADAPKRLPRARFRCPRDMVRVPAGPAVFRVSGQRYIFSGEQDRVVEVGDFCIDRYEGSRPEATATSPDGGHDKAATSRAGVVPWTLVRWSQAKAACERVGKRLCTGAEWQKAAGGPAGLLYPNGWEFDSGVCNTFTREIGARPLAPTGRFPKCKSPYGAYDMTGNVSEWTDELWQDGWPDRALRGGSFNVNPINGQALLPFFGWRFIGYGESVASLHHHPPDDAHADDGFRCCLTP
ncbi:MAG: formylglycine-generating enzyme family protein [Candidatus Lernaella stagnicola]|nr:formylglycine-generating enzyme family protein [Candidatus Lernaella stagnicola]